MKYELSFITTNLRGGYSDSFDFAVADIIPDNSKNLFFYPIPPEFLYTKSKLLRH